MPKDKHSTRWSRFLAWAVAGLFVLGFFVSPIGVWTGPILATWFVGTQKPAAISKTARSTRPRPSIWSRRRCSTLT